ncbi:MAG: glutamate-cysteine ligase family protein [Actinomycetota bacterium]|nr:glutamate-cysteine ligase family protein [Actinomycetota bacterium]
MPADRPSIARKNLQHIVDYLESGHMRCEVGSVGVEIEHQVVRRVTHDPVPYSGPQGIEAILEGLAPFFDERTYSERHLTGLTRADSNVTIEPAGQIELSIAPQCRLSEIMRIYQEFRARFDEVLADMDAEALTLGYHPHAHARELELIPKDRYRLMDAHFARTGQHGVCMMRGSASTQVSIDYRDEADAIRKFRLATAIGPLISFITDNAPVFEDEIGTGRMVRTAIWNDVDPERSMEAPGLFDFADYSFGTYAETIMDSDPVLVMNDGKAVSSKERTASEIYADHELSTAEVEHLLSMFFFDVRLKHYVEIRMADSMPIEYSIAYAALIKGLFYDDDNLLALEQALPELHDEDIADAKLALMADGYTATVYGRPAHRWLDDLLVWAWRGLPADERSYLTPLARLVEHRTTLLDEAFDTDDDADDTIGTLTRNWYRTMEGLSGDVEGHRIAWDSMQSSTALYHDEVIRIGYAPFPVSRNMQDVFGDIAETTHRILVKIIEAYRTDPAYRRLFDFDPELERLICLEQRYHQHLPICRVDIFMDTEGPRDSRGFPAFQFCEFNTDGSSAMNEDRATAAALLATPTAEALSDRYLLIPQTLFDPWVRCFMGIVHEAIPQVTDPHVAIVDFTASATTYEFEEFRKRFEAHGVRCTICDIADLSFDGTTLRDHDGTRIDAVYRRAVTMEVMEEREDAAKAFVDAVSAGAVVSIGNFETHACHTKLTFEVIRHEATLALLDEDEVDFVLSHVPPTFTLTEDAPLLDDVLDNPRDWIIKPKDGYAAHGVIAGRGVERGEWREFVLSHLDGTHVVQTYCEQFAIPNEPLMAPGEDQPTRLPYNQLIGMYVYDGEYTGTYVRAGQAAIIAGVYGGLTEGSLLVRRRR